ncbi:MAG: hypothetical protein ACOC2H_04400 [Spirochaetota bacterium]
MIRLLILHILSVLLFVTSLYGAVPNIKATVQPQKSRPGVQNTYTVAFSAPDSSYTVSLPDESVTDEKTGLPLYRIYNTDEKRHEEDGLFYLTVTVTIAYFKPGTYELPMVSILDPDGIAVGYRQPVIDIESVNKSGEFEDIEGPFVRRGNYTRLLLIILSALVLGAGAFVLYRFLRSRVRQNGDGGKSVDPAADFHERYGRLQKKEYLERGLVEPFCTELSAIFRRYLQLRYGFPALDMTTDEITAALVQKGMPNGQTDSLRRIMRLWDLAKFAEMRPSTETIRLQTEELMQYIQSTTSENGRSDDI